MTANGWPVHVHPLPPLLHNQPQSIAGQVEELAVRLRDRYRTVAVGYADCGTYGALDAVCARLDVPRLPGTDCYELFAGTERLRALLDAEPGTYVLTDFLARTFAHTVLRELGLDRRPELRDPYFGNYTRVLWLAQRPTPATRAAAERAAASIGLPLEEVVVGDVLLERALALIGGHRIRP